MLHSAKHKNIKGIVIGDEEIFLNGKYYDKLHMDILENEFWGSYIKNKNI